MEKSITPSALRHNYGAFGPRNSIIKAFQNETKDLQSLKSDLIGEPGLQRAYPLSTWLYDYAAHQADQNLKWFLPKLIGTAAISTVLWEVVIESGLSYLVGEGTISALGATAINRTL